VTTGEEVVLVQEYVHGVPLHWLLRTAHESKTHVPINVAVSVACQVLAGLQAAHETADEMGTPLNIVHRDVSPQNVMIATDGTARLLDFGVAKASLAAHTTRDGTFKGKLAYSAPEQIMGKAVQQSDIYSLSVVLWELIVGHRMHGSAQAEAELIGEIMSGSLPTITDALAVEHEWLGNNRWKQLELIEPIIQRGLSVEASARQQTAAEMEAALASAVPPATPTGVSAWLKALGKSFLEGRDRIIAEEEASWRRSALSSAPRRLSGPIRIPTSPGTAVTMPDAPVPDRRRSIGLLATIGGLAFALVIAIAFLAKGNGEQAKPQAASLAPPPVAAALVMPAPEPAPVPVAKPIAAAPKVAPPPPEPEPVAEPEPEPVPVRAVAVVAPAPRPVTIVRRPMRASIARARMAQPSSAPPPPPIATPEPPPPPPAAAPASADDCNPPYYFQGSKKVFKPACI
jgi:serine/threonine-protein kinase